MDVSAVLARLVATIDAHDWAALPALLHEDFVCRLVHTGETFDRDAWVRFNADYPGFDRMVLRDLVAGGERVVGRAHVTGFVGDGGGGELHHFEVAMFLTVRAGLIVENIEVWAEVGQTAPDGTRLS